MSAGDASTAKSKPGAGSPKSARDPLGGSRRPVLRFVLTFVILVGGFNLLFYAWLAESDLFEGYLAANARASAWILKAVGETPTTSSTFITTPKYSLDIRRGCDAVQVSVFYIVAVLATPVLISWWRRLTALVLGTAFILGMNLVRIISLYYTGVFAPDYFHMMHIDVWQPFFIFLTLFLWLFWFWRLTRPASRQAAVPA